MALRKARGELKELGIDPSAGNLARYKDRPVEYFDESIELDVLANPLYLDADSNMSDGVRMYGRPNSLGDNIPDPESQDDYLEAETGFTNDSLYDVLGRLLDDREKKVIELHFGLNGQGGERRTLGQLATELKVTPEAVRRMQARALSKLGHPTNGGLPEIADQDAPEWFYDAACKGLPTELFYPVRGAGNQTAKEACKACTAKKDCFEYALSRKETGVWGDTSERERKQIRRAARVAALAVNSQTT